MKISAITALLGVGSIAAASAATPPNIVIIMADDIGYGDLSCNIPDGAPRTISTPNVERLAQRGIRFTNAHATAATSTPSRYSLLTGEYAWRRPGTGVAPGDAAMIITPDRATLPRMLQSAGYRTAAVGKWHLGVGSKRGKQNWNGEITPGLKDIGFDYSYIMAATGDRVPCVYIEDGRVVGLDLKKHPEDSIFVSYSTPFAGEPTGRDNPELLRLHPSPNHGHDQAIINGISRIGYMKGGGKALWHDQDIADSVTEAAVRFIEREDEKLEPFFLYFCTNDIHVPRDPHPRFVGRSGMGARGDALLQFDWSVGRILDVLDSLDLADNTLVLLTSDNGPVVDDGYADRAVELLGNHLPGGEWRGGKYSNFEAGTRVPMVVRWPEAMRRGKTPKQPAVSDAAVSQVDLYATFAALAGVKPDHQDGEAPDSYNVLSALRGKDDDGRPHIVENAGSLSVTTPDGWKYIAPSGGRAFDELTRTELGNQNAPQLYDLGEDRAEQHNLAASQPERVAAMSALLEKIRSTPDAK